MFLRHYEKVIAGCCFLFIFVNMGLASTAFSVHQPYLVSIEGVGDTGGSLILSVRTLVSFFAMLVVDRYYRALDVRLGVLIACLFTAVGFGVYGLSTSLPTFFVGAALLGLGYGMGGMVAMTYLANRWFASGIGGVIGFASMGSGIASIVMPLVVVHVIEASSLSTAFFMEGGLAAVIGVLVFALLRNRPSDMGLTPFSRNGTDADKSERSASSAAKPTRETAHPLRRALMPFAMVCVGTFCCCGMTYLSVLATSSGFDTVFAALLVSTAGASLTVAKYVVGKLFDYLGTTRASAIMFCFAGVGFALCCFAGTGSRAIMMCGALAMGAGLSLGSVGVSVWSLRLSDASERTRQIKNFQVAYSLGGFIANTLPGFVKDLVGTYMVTYAAMVGVVACAAIIILYFSRMAKGA